jgi:hypothetical protein
MRRRGWVWLAWGAFLFHGGFASAQNSLDALEQELKEAKQQHQEVASAALTNFFSQIDAAMGSSDAAVALYEQAGGSPPAPAPVVTAHENETATEKEARLALDQGNLSKLGAALQLHCGLMHYAALFVVKPDQKGLQDDWVAWLKSVAPVYPQLAVPAESGEQNPEHHKRKRNNAEDGAPAAARQPPFNPEDIKGKAMRDSLISKFLGFSSWDDKEQGGWSVRDLPKLYRTNVLEPLRASPTAATLAAWDAYIAMANADEQDNDRWNQVVYPPLEFDRACDDYAVAPGTEKLEGLVSLIKENPTNPHVDDWIARVHQLLLDYRANQGGNAPVAQNPAMAPAPSTLAADPNVSVTTIQQGDMTIITTHTNSAPMNAPPAH